MNSRLVRYETWLRTFGFVVAGGAVLSVAAFLLTSTTPSYIYLGPACAQNVAGPAFDPWTGQPHGRIYDTWDCFAAAPGTLASLTRVVDPVPDEMLGRNAIPLPVGFAVGCVITVGAMAVLRRRPKDPALGLANC